MKWENMPSKLTVLTACSGIGAPEHAWRDLPFNFIGCSEIEAFPSAVLKHHYPNVTNYGDMTKYRDWKIDEPITALFAGTPCQSFSVAGLRQGMDSPNGNLALVYLAMVERFAPRWIIYENVIGLLSSNGGRDFGAFVGALGELGFGYCYRVLDAKYWGVAQRRRRVFVVGYFGDWKPAAAVLFERGSLSRNLEKGRGTRKKFTAPIKKSSGATVYENHATDSRIKEVEVCPTITRRWGTGGNNVPLVQAESDNLAYALPGNWIGRSPKNGGNQTTPATEVSPTLTRMDVPAVLPKQDMVRRISPEEGELLMGFEKGYTDIQFRGRPASDANRYRALGNSMAVPVVKWIGQRILMVEEAKMDMVK